MTISPSQLVKVPSVEVCRELAVASPESQGIAEVAVSFQGVEYDVHGAGGDGRKADDHPQPVGSRMPLRWC